MAAIIENNGDASADSGTRYAISLGDVFQGTLDSAVDTDWIRVELTTGTIYDISQTGIESVRLRLYDSGGNFILYSDAHIIFSPPVSGTYYVHVFTLDSNRSGDYEISLVENTIPEGTYDEIADYLTDGFSEFYDGLGRTAFDVAPGGVLNVNITDLTEEGKQLARWALEAWTNVTGIQFEFVDDDNAHIAFTDGPTGVNAGPVVVNDGVIGFSNVNVDARVLDEYEITIDSYPFQLYIHEIGHALGLGHSGPYPPPGAPASFAYGVDNIFLNDSWQVTIMSYAAQSQNTYRNASQAIYVTPMIVDIIAIQNLYGEPVDIHAGDTVYGYQSNLDGYLGEVFKLWTDEENPFISISAAETNRTRALVDLDGDGDHDVVMGSLQGAFHYFENTGTAGNPVFTERIDTANPLKIVDGKILGAPEFIDFDNDNDLDLVIRDTSGIIRYFENTGMHTAPEFVKTTSFSGPVTLTLYDNGGNDTLDLRVDREDQRVDLRPEGISDVYGLVGNLIIARDTMIENFVAGSGNDVVTGNAAANSLEGRNGADTLWGGAGNDTLSNPGWQYAPDNIKYLSQFVIKAT